MKKVYLALSAIRLIPHIILFNLSSKKIGITYEIKRWLNLKGIEIGVQTGFLHLMTFYPEFRNLFYYRIGPYSKLLNFLCPKMNTLFIVTQSIGFGLYIQHGFATIINAETIGNDCTIQQQVTIGYQGLDCPVINDNVIVTSGAKIIGNVNVGSNTIVGTNAVVVKDVPDNCTVVGVPAYIVKRDGIKVRENLV